MKRLLALVLVTIISAIAIFSFVAIASDNFSEKTQIECINDQLTGTWTSIDSENVYSKWSFLNGQYVLETYLDGELMENSTIGVYAIGTEAIYTVTIDQDSLIEGSIPYAFKNGVLTLNGRNGCVITKDD